MADWYRWDNADLILHCKLQPKASADEWAGEFQDHIRIRITAPPVDGKANAHLIAFLAAQFGTPKNAVSIEKGELGRLKRIRIRAPQRFPAKLNMTHP